MPTPPIPAVLAALGLTPDGIQLLLRLRRERAAHRRSAWPSWRPMLGPAGQFLRLEGNSILTIRATARVRLANGQLSDMKRTVAAQVKYMPHGSSYPHPLSCAGTTPRGATSQSHAPRFCHLQRLPETARLRLRRGPRNRRHGSRSRGHAGAPQQDPGAGPSHHRKLRRASRGRVGRGVRAVS